MSSRKKSTSTTESSSGSTSGTSSSSESSSGSDSNSSSSDSESTTSQEAEPTRRSSGSNNHQDAKSLPSSTGQTTAVTKKPARRASDTRPQNKAEQGEKLSTSASNKGKAIAAASKAQHQRSSRPQVSIYSSDDDGPSPKTQIATKRAQNDTKKKLLQTNKSKASTTTIAPVTGGKAPPAVVKQQQQQLQNLNKNPVNKSGAASKVTQKASIAKNNLDSKDKSIFSPDNTTESEEDVKAKNAKVPPTKTVKPPPRPKGRPPKLKVVEKPPPIVKSSAESSSTASTSDSTSTSDSDSESSAASAPLTKKISETKPADKTNTSITKSDSKDNHANSDSDIENKATSNVVRKLTRSSSTRKSKHLTAIFNPGKASDSDSEADSKRSLSKSPVKRAPATKGKSKNSKSNAKNNSSPTKKTSTVPEERHCPVDGCESIGHLGGILNKHFTQEACPLYHNMTLTDTKAWASERQQREEERNKAQILYEPSKKQQTVDQKAYQLKVKEIRSKFKPPLKSPTRSSHTNAHFLNQKDVDREPNLAGLVSDYDLQLFREAQARSSEKIEEELKDIETGKGTKYIIMGRHKMEVWYQSPYPDDAARLPKLYLCEFCLTYQKCEIGMKRHAAKCVWRHPPGDEVTIKQNLKKGKGKICVWQVDGKRQKQYSQHLCLLAKFFLDHKTLYYDVEPFLFYIMTLADTEGCHTVGYFSKEKNSFLNYNVSCILTLPPYQRKGFGRLLIDFSYLLTRVEGKIGSPEKPLSDLGLISYRSYWKDVLLDYLCNRTGTTLSIKDVSQEMAINSYDIVSTLQALGMMKYWKGKHIILKKQDVIEEYEERVKSRGMVLKIDSSCLRWTPFQATPLGPS